MSTRIIDDGDPSAALIAAKGISIWIGEREIVQNVDLAIGRGEIVTLIGPNGSGKTTVLRAMLGLLAPDTGTIRRRRGIRIGYVPQHMHVDRTLPISVRRFLRLGGRSPSMLDVLQEVGALHVVDSPLHAISGGELKRVLLARALLGDPDLLALDEPTAGVDVSGQAELYRLIADIRDRRNCAILLVSHDLHLVMAATDEVICLNGHICCRGRPEAVTRDPAYLSLFGPMVDRAFAVYAHQHDHKHDLAGTPQSETTPENSREERPLDG